MSIPHRLDLALAAASVIVGAMGVHFELTESARPPLVPAFGAYLIAIATGVLLGWRRRAPVAVASAIVAFSLLYHLLGYPGLAPAIGMFVAAHAVTAHAGGRRLQVAAALIVAVSVVPVLPPYPASFNLGALFGPPMLMIAAAAVGEAARARRVAAQEQLRAVRQAAAEEARRQLVEERLNIARELHDVLAHTITVISVQAAVGADALDERPDDTRAALAAVRSAARDAMAELRSALGLLRNGAEPAAVAAPQPGLGQLPRLVDQASAAGVTVRMATTGEPDGLPAAVELAVYRIIQEALTNTIRHSAAGAAAVAITFGPEEVAVEVTDDGPAALAVSPTERDDVAVHGLTGMRERARALGGSLDAGPLPGSGFRVAARLPVRGSA